MCECVDTCVCWSYCLVAISMSSVVYMFQGLCKLGTTGGGTVNDQTFAEGATLKLYKSVRR